MAAFRRQLSIALFALLASGAAKAQQFGAQQGFGGPSFPQQSGPTLIGTWSGLQQSQLGPSQQTDYFDQNGNFVSVGLIAGGMSYRVWGQYRATPIGPNQLRVDFQTQGYLPQQICMQAPGMSPNCSPPPFPQTDTVMVTFTSPSSFQSVGQQGSIFENRDPDPYLLQRQIPAQQVINIPAAPQQNMAGGGGAIAPQMPVMPKITPYDQSAVHKGMNDFVYGRLRGCNYKATTPTTTTCSGCDR